MSWQHPQHSEVEIWLQDYDSAVSAAECHGLLCGFLSTGEALDAARLREYLVPGLTAEDQPHWQETFENLFREVAASLQDEQMQFQPLLPDDNAPIMERRDALGDWCQGFLLGQSMGGIDKTTSLPENVREIVNDIIAISQAGDYDTDEDEEDEQAYMELVEYLRTGVLLIHAENQGRVTSGE